MSEKTEVKTYFAVEITTPDVEFEMPGYDSFEEAKATMIELKRHDDADTTTTYKIIKRIVVTTTIDTLLY